MWPFTGCDHLDGSDVVKVDAITAILTALGTEYIDWNDLEYRRLSERQMREFVRKNQWSMPRYKKYVSDCDDFALLARADIVKAWINTGADLPLVFGIIDAFMGEAKDEHSFNFTILSDGRVLLYQPQSRKWSADLPQLRRITRVHF